jgi:hypothetical protein
VNDEEFVRWLLGLLICSSSVYIIATLLLRLHRRRHHRCTNCGFAMSDHPEGQCP